MHPGKSRTDLVIKECLGALAGSEAPGEHGAMKRGAVRQSLIPSIWSMSTDDLVLDDTDLGPDEPPPVHNLVSAADQPLPDTRGWPSIFDFAGYVGLNPGATHAPPLKATNDRKSLEIQDQVHLSIVRSVGLVRCRRVHYLDTVAWQEKEQARRARQKLPKPPKQSFRLRKEPACC